MMIEVYGKENCPQCEVMKRILDSKNMKYAYYMVGKDVTREELLEKCQVPVRSVPVVFKDGKQIVGTVQQVAAQL